MSSKILTDKIIAIIKPIIELLGYRLWGIEIKSGKKTLIRVYIESANGTGIEDCVKISRQISGVLDVEFPTLSIYDLEVSSPGMDRILFTKEQYAQFIHQMVHIRLRVPINGRRNFQGEIIAIENEKLTISADNSLFNFELPDIAEARLIPKF